VLPVFMFALPIAPRRLQSVSAGEHVLSELLSEVVSTT
jgi:hypothetical protein